MISDTTFVYHFVYPDLGIYIVFEKQETTEKEGIEFEIGY